MGTNYVVVYDESKCGRCGKVETLDKMFWSDVEMSHVCKECVNFPDKKEK
jgi:hypothetical protein